MQDLGVDNYERWQAQRGAAGAAGWRPRPAENQEAAQPFDNRLHVHHYTPRRQGRSHGHHAGAQWAGPQWCPTVWAAPPAPAPRAPQGYYPGYPGYIGHPGYPGYPGPYQPVHFNNPGSHRHVYYGKTEREIEADYARIARREGINQPNAIAPHNPRDDQMFWVRDVDGFNHQATYHVIDNDYKPGYWRTDHRFGNLYFVRTRE